MAERVRQRPSLRFLRRGDVGFDLPVLMGVVLTVSTMIVLLNLLVDLVYAYMDPRVRVA